MIVPGAGQVKPAGHGPLPLTKEPGGQVFAADATAPLPPPHGSGGEGPTPRLRINTRGPRGDYQAAACCVEAATSAGAANASAACATSFELPLWIAVK